MPVCSQKRRTSVKAARTEAPVAPVWLHVKIVQRSDLSTIFHRKFQGQHEMSDILLFSLNNPDVADTLIVEHRTECSSCSFPVECVTAFIIEVSHETNQH